VCEKERRGHRVPVLLMKTGIHFFLTGGRKGRRKINEEIHKWPPHQMLERGAWFRDSQILRKKGKTAGKGKKLHPKLSGVSKRRGKEIIIPEPQDLALEERRGERKKKMRIEKRDRNSGSELRSRSKGGESS